MSAKDNADFLMRYAQANGITDKKELANFMGQMTVESGGFTSMNEQLGYSGKRLFEVFEGRNGINTRADADRVAAGGPESIANTIYGGTYGKSHLNNTQPGDGWAFHGRGFVQLTGRKNYTDATNGLGIDFVNHPELAADRENAAKIAVLYWKTRVVKEGDQTNVDKACTDINGGTHGLPERRAAAKAWEEALDKGYKPGGPEPLPGGAGGGRAPSESLRHAQQLLNQQGYHTTAGKPLGEDGRMGPQTKQAIEAFQRDHGLKVDGIVGKNTLHELEKAQPQPVAHPTTRLDDPAHAGNSLYNEALASVERLDAAQGRTTDQVSKQFAGSVAVEAHAQGLSRIDHIILSENGAKAWAVQGELNSPFKQIAEVNTQQAVSASVEQSSQRWKEAQSQQQSTPTQPLPQQTQAQQPSMQP